MGASGWRYFTPYQPDINAALQALRQRVFEGGAYGDPITNAVHGASFLSRFTSKQAPGSAPQIRDLIEGLRKMNKAMASGISPAEAVSLLGRCATPQAPRGRRSQKRTRSQVNSGGATQRGRGPRSIKALLKQRGGEGTHSILDITEGISPTRKFASAFPMPDDIKLKEFGTLQPTREQVEAADMLSAEDLDRWECWYAIVYKDGQPSEIYFEGCSGD